jgi:hypothetical protein
LVALVGGSESEIMFRVVLGGGGGTAINTDRRSPVVPAPVYSGSCVGNTASVFNDRFQTFICIRLGGKLPNFRTVTDSKTANGVLRVAVQV